MGLSLDGVAMGATVAEAPPLRETLVHVAELAKELDRVRDITATAGVDPAMNAGMNAERMTSALRVTGHQRFVAVETPVPTSKRNFQWDLRSPKRTVP